MSDSLRDQLLGLGFKAPAKPGPKGGHKSSGRQDKRQERRPGGNPGIEPRHGKPGRGDKPARPQRGDAARGEIDLAKAYAIRAQREKDERIEAERLKQEEARKRREARAKLAELLKDKGLNVADAEIARHFFYGGKIKRVYVTAEQLPRLNAGELGVVQMDGRYLLVDTALLDQAKAIFPPAVALRVDPNAAAGEDPYADPSYQVPDDLVW